VMRRCWGLTRNLSRCSRTGDWLFFCSEHKRKPIIWVSYIVFTIGVGIITYSQFVSEHFRSTETVPAKKTTQTGKGALHRDSTHGRSGSMVRQGRDLEKLVAMIESSFISEDAEIKSPDYIIDKVTGHPREVDISIKKTIGSIPILVIIECRDRSDVQDVRWIEQVAQKRTDLNASKAVAVSRSGFTGNALIKAQHLDINTRLFEQITEDDIRSWFQAGDLVVYTMQSKISFVNADLDLSSLGPHAKEQTDALDSDHMSKSDYHAPIFVNKKDGKKYSIINIWQSIPQKDIIYQGVPRDGSRIERHLVIDFPNKSERLGMKLPIGMVDVFKITVVATVWIDASTVPISDVYSYRDDNSELLTAVEYQLDVRGRDAILSFHRKTKFGDIGITLR